MMKVLTLEAAADYLESAVIENSINAGHAVVHTGKSDGGNRFVLVNDWTGETVLTEAP